MVCVKRGRARIRPLSYLVFTKKLHSRGVCVLELGIRTGLGRVVAIAATPAGLRTRVTRVLIEARHHETRTLIISFPF